MIGVSAVLIEDAIILGVTCDSVSYDAASPTVDDDREHFSRYATLERTSQIYLHHLLRQLLRRNLGVHLLLVDRFAVVALHRLR